MKQGKSVQELAIELQRQLDTKRDFIAPISKLRLDSIVGEDGNRNAVKLSAQDNKWWWDLTDTCHDQIGSHLEIPTKYYHRLRSELPELLCQNVNAWFGRGSEKRMVRTMDGKARAFLSDRYRPLDNFELANVVLPRLNELDCRIESCELTEKRFYIKAVSSKISGEVSVGDEVQAGVIVSNSEIGCGSLSVEPFIFRLICRNGAIAKDFSMRKYHIGKKSGREEIDWAQEFFRDETRMADDRAFWLKVQDLVSGTLSKDGFERILEQHRRAKNLPIVGNPMDIVEVVTKRNGLTEYEKDGVIKHLIQGGELSLYGLANAVTRTSQDVLDYDRATELERMGGGLIALPQNEWAEMAVINRA